MKKHVHFLGIGGSGASAIAAIASAQGYIISGCDTKPFNEFTAHFDQSLLFQNHSESHLQNVDILAITPAILSLDPNNPEIKAAKLQDIPVMTWQEFMGQFLEQGKFVIAVCGTHGKSTTTAMTGILLEDANLDPIVEIGAIVSNWQANYRIGKGEFFVSEADEFNDNFLATTPDIAIVTTIEMDHPEYFKDFDDYKQSFVDFLSKTKKAIVANMSDPGVLDVITSLQSLALQVQVIDYSKRLIEFPLKVIGKHNVYNASAVYQTGLLLGIPEDKIKSSLQGYNGIGRRLELVGRTKSSQIYSDYAHHPTEIKVSVKAIQGQFPDKKIVVVFQPHMFSRTHTLFNDFVAVFQNLAIYKSYITDIFPSREIDTGLVSSKQLVESIGQENVLYQPDINIIFEQLQKDQPDIILFMGAGDADKWAKNYKWI